MKTTTILSVSFFCLLFSFSCKKNEVPDPLILEENSATLENSKELDNAPLTEISVLEDSHDFGNLKKGDVVEHVFEIKNSGDKPLVISSVNPTCGCTVPDYTKNPILPGDIGKITLKFDSSGFSGKVSKSTVVHLNAEQSPVKLTFAANIKD